MGEGNPEIAQLLQVKFGGIKIKSAWEGPARIFSNPHVVVLPVITCF
jgi:acetoacetate decarboxylase